MARTRSRHRAVILNPDQQCAAVGARQPDHGLVDLTVRQRTPGLALELDAQRLAVGYRFS